MLTLEQIQSVKTILEQQKTHLPHYKEKLSPLHYLEARCTLANVEHILVRKNVNRSQLLEQLLEDRWDRLKNTSIQYCYQLENPANIVCVHLAKMLEGVEQKPWLALLMPSLTEVPTSQYISSRYDETLDLQDIILNDNNNRLISIPDVLNFAHEDGILKHNSLFYKLSKTLSLEEKQRLLSKHPSINQYYQALQARVTFMLYGDTVGAYLTRLISGLHDGGVNGEHDGSFNNLRGGGLNWLGDGGVFRFGTERESGTSAANAIIEFYNLLEMLDEDTYHQLFTSGKFDRRTTSNPVLITFKNCWDNLTRPENNFEIRYCVNSIADEIEEILEENPGLYDLLPYQGEAFETLANLNNTLETCKQQMITDMQSTTQFAYSGTEANNQFVFNLCTKLVQFFSFTLAIDDLVLIAGFYSSAKEEQNKPIEDQSKLLLRHVGRTYPKVKIDAALEKMTETIKHDFITLTTPQPKVKIASNRNPLFSLSIGKKRGLETDSYQPDQPYPKK